jgi:hypothetical protein
MRRPAIGVVGGGARRQLRSGLSEGPTGKIRFLTAYLSIFSRILR